MMAASHGPEEIGNQTLDVGAQIQAWGDKHILARQMLCEAPNNAFCVEGISCVEQKEGNIEFIVIIKERSRFYTGTVASIVSHWKVEGAPVMPGDATVVDIFQSFFEEQGISKGVVKAIKDEKTTRSRFSSERVIVEGVKLTFPQESLQRVLDNLLIESSEVLEISSVEAPKIPSLASDTSSLLVQQRDLDDRQPLLKGTPKRSSPLLPHSSLLRTGFCNNPFFNRNFAGTRLPNKAEPQRGYKDSKYFSFALKEVFDAESRYFWLERNKRGELVPSDSSTARNELKLFFGVQDFWPGNGIYMSYRARFFALVFYVFMGGWVLSPLMNLVKAVTELPLKLVAEFFCWSKDSLREKYGEGFGLSDPTTFKAMAWYWQVLYVVCRTLQLLFAGLHLLVRMVVSPVESAKVAYNAGYTHGWLNQALTVMSAVSSALCWLGFLIGGGPLLLLIAPKLGISLAPVAHSGLAHFSAPITALLTTKLGFVASTALTGAVTLSTTILFFLGLHEARKALNTWFAAGCRDDGPTESRPYALIS